jgi:hypothetical protein
MGQIFEKYIQKLRQTDRMDQTSQFSQAASKRTFHSNRSA